MNYRHAFHAGNFADVIKHALLLAVLARLGREGPVRVFDTHAGAGLYDLDGPDARRSGEALAGIGRVLEGEAPDALQPLLAAVRTCNPQAGPRLYPGSPVLAAGALGRGGRYVGCESDGQAFALLKRALATVRRPEVEATAIEGDGVALGLKALAEPAYQPSLLLVDPPFERGDDYDAIVRLVRKLVRAKGWGALIWTPLKDLETFDALLSRLEAERPRSLGVAEVRLRPLHDPMRMNGCALVMVNLPEIEAADALCRWVAGRLGEAGARGRFERVIG